MVEVIRSDGHLPANNMEGMGSVPPTLSQCLRQDSIGRPLKHQTDDWLKTYSIDIASSLFVQDGVPYQDLVGTSPIRIWGWDLQKRMGLDSWLGERNGEKMTLGA